MSMFENLTPFLVIALLLATAAVGALCARTELRLAARHKVRLAEYRRKNYLFYIGRDLPLCIITGVLALATVALLVACVINPILNAYIAVLGVLLAVEGSVIYLSLSRAKCARDVRVFDLYYVKVENLLSGKERTLADIAACRARTAELRAKLDQTLSGFNSHLSSPVSADFVDELFAPLLSMLSEYSREIDRFSGEIEVDFTDALNQFLRTNEQPELRILPLRRFDAYVVDDLLAQIKSTYGTRIAADVVAEAERGAVKNARAIGQIMALLHSLDVTVEPETLAKCLRVAATFPDREQLFSQLYADRQISCKAVCEQFVPEGWDFAFVPRMAAAFNRRELSQIIDCLLRENRSEMLCRLLASLAPADIDLLAQAIERAQACEALSMARACYLLLTNSYAVGNRASLAETLALFLSEHRREVALSDSERERFNAIFTEGDYAAHAEEIYKLYALAAGRAERLVRSARRVLLQYLCDTPEGFLSPVRLAALFNEFVFTLSFGDLSLMRALLAAWLLREGSEASRAVVRAELAAQPALKVVPAEGAPDAALSAAIFKNLVGGNRMHLCSLIYRTECERCTLDRVLALGKEEG